MITQISHLKRPRQHGFTLIEIIVVVALLGIILAIVPIRFAGQSPADKLKTEAIRAQALIDILLEESLFQSKEFGIEFLENTYEFSEYDPEEDKFATIDGDKMFRKREMPENIVLELVAEGLSDDINFYDEDEAQPQVILYSSGEISPAFELYFRSEQTDIHYILKVEGSGITKVEKEGSDL